MHIFHAAAAPVDFLFSSKIPEEKNHYVPLLPIENSNKTVRSINHHLKRKQTTISFEPKKFKECNINVEKNSFTKKLHETGDCHAATFSHSSEDSDISNDIGHFYNLSASSFSDEKKYNLLCGTWRPDHSLTFPRNSSGRRFQLKWLAKFPWLVYSRILDGAFCLHCVLFGGESSHNASKLQYLYSLPLTYWKTALQKFSEHEQKSPIHLTATLKASNFLSCMRNNTRCISVQFDTKVMSHVTLNRDKLKPIVDVIILCGKQNIALRGHRDDAKYCDEAGFNPGNLQAILSYLATCGRNELFNDFFLNGSKRATYRSKTTQNELINICGDVVSRTIINEIKEAKYFSIMANEAADISKMEQLPIVIRYVDKSSTATEKFLGFVPCARGLSGESISSEILKWLDANGLDIKLCRGQGYDGAGSMAGKVKGVAARIQRCYPRAIYVHCGSHLLNLAVASSCSIQEISSMLEPVREVTQFFNSHPKHCDRLCSKITVLLPSARHSRLVDFCRTRWVARLDALDVFIEAFRAIVAALEPDVIKAAYNHFNGVFSFEFIVTLVISCRLLGITRPLTKQLQSSTLDALSAIDKITLLFTTLKRIRKDIDEMHGEWYAEGVEIANQLGIVPCKPRTVDVQIYRCNVPSSSISE